MSPIYTLWLSLYTSYNVSFISGSNLCRNIFFLIFRSFWRKKHNSFYFYGRENDGKDPNKPFLGSWLRSVFRTSCFYREARSPSFGKYFKDPLRKPLKELYQREHKVVSNISCIWSCKIQFLQFIQ